MQNEIVISSEAQQPVLTPNQATTDSFDCLVMRRNGKVTPFDQSKIMVAITKAFLAVEGSAAAASARVHENVEKLTAQVVKVLLRRLPENSTIHIEDIQDQVELALMREGHHKVARAYVLYRAARAEERETKQADGLDEKDKTLYITTEDGGRKPLDMQRLQTLLDEATHDLEGANQQAVHQAIERNLFDGMKEADYRLALVMSARAMIEQDPAYSEVAARILLDNARYEALSFIENMPTYASQQDMQSQYATYFPAYIHKAVELELLDEELTRYDLQALGQALQADKDHTFNYLGLQTLYDRYFVHSGSIRFELPQAFFMRVAMGLAINEAKLEKTITTAMRMLDNVIDYNFYSVPQARKSNLRHRPVGMGIMGFTDTLHQLNLAYASEEAVEFADRSMEMVSYYAIQASCDLAAERGRYASFEGSLWSQGILPIDSIALLKEARGEQYLQVDESTTKDWDSLRDKVQQQGMRNSNVLAIAPTATIANICGVSQSIEPSYQNLYVKSNLSGEFVVMNNYLADDLKALGLWDEVMVNDLKYYDGSVQAMERVPEHIKAKYATAFEIDSRWLIEAASRRQKWIDQAQSLNLYMAEPSGKKLDNLYKLAWVRGLKTTYYLRSLGASHVEKSTDSITQVDDEPKVCSILDPDCEACQ